MADLKDKSEELEKDPPETEEVEEAEPVIKDPVDKNESIEVQVKPSRQEKKQNRFREFEERTTKAEQAAEEARREAREARERLDRLQQVPGQPQQQPQQSKLQQIQLAKQRLNEMYMSVASQPGYDQKGPQQKEFERQAQALEDMRIDAIWEEKNQKHQSGEADRLRQAKLEMYLNEHADISQDRTKMQWAYARWQQNIAEGQLDTKEMSDRVFDEARIKFGLQPRNRRGSRPDQATRARLSGVSSQSAGAEQSSANVSMNAMQRKMARELYDKDPPAVAYQKWANGPGKRAQEKRAAK